MLVSIHVGVRESCFDFFCHSVPLLFFHSRMSVAYEDGTYQGGCRSCYAIQYVLKIRIECHFSEHCVTALEEETRSQYSVID